MEYIGWERTLLGTVIHARRRWTRRTISVRATSRAVTLPCGVSLQPCTATARLEPRTLIETLRERGLLDQNPSFEDPDVTGEDYIRELVGQEEIKHGSLCRSDPAKRHPQAAGNYRGHHGLLCPRYPHDRRRGPGSRREPGYRDTA